MTARNQAITAAILTAAAWCFQWGIFFFFLPLMGCTSMLPMTHDMKAALPEAQVQRIAEITKLTPEQVREPTIHEVHEVTLGCWQMVQECYAGVPLYLKLLGSVPMGCTKIIQQPWNEKVAIVYTCWWTDPLTKDHEREHAKGMQHAYW